jgi:hypothetical protein
MRIAGRLFCCAALLVMGSGCAGDTGEQPQLGTGSGGSAGKSGGSAGAWGVTGGSAGAAGRASDGGRSGAGGNVSCPNGCDSAGRAGSGADPGEGPSIAGCQVFPENDVWNQDISAAPADADWTRRLHALVGNVNLHPDYGGGGGELYGIPINVVPQTQPAVGVDFYWYDDESDPGPFPLPGPLDVIIEGNDPLQCDGDCHLLVVQQGSCQLFEGYACYYAGGWQCGGGASWDLTRVSYGQRQKGWTSADAAGLAITPGVLRYDEVRRGAVRHALRFTVPCTSPNYVAPATHYAVPGGCSESDPNAPPMGLRVRLRADYDVSGASESARVVLRAMQRYGMILADNGSSFYFQGEANPGWTDDDIEPLKDVPASAFEVITPPALEN